MTHLFRTAALASLLVAALACGDDDNTGPNGSDGTLTASVDGTAFTGNLAVQAVYTSNTLSLGATQTVGTTVKQFNITVLNVTATGTFSFATGAATGVYSETVGTTGVKAWTTSLPGSTGSITITQLTSTRVAGTFSFTAPPSTGATGTKNVTSGNFSIDLQ